MRATYWDLAIAYLWHTATPMVAMLLTVAMLFPINAKNGTLTVSGGLSYSEVVEAPFKQLRDFGRLSIL